MLSEAVILSEFSIFDLSGGQGQSETERVITHCDCILLDRGAGKFAGSGYSHSPRLPAKHAYLIHMQVNLHTVACTVCACA